MHITPSLAAAGLFIGFCVGLTGMGGGAPLTALLVSVFRVPPLAAVSSDLLVSLIMKPFGVVAHLRRRTIHWPLVRLLTVGSVPAAVAGAAVIGAIGHGEAAQRHLKLGVGVALCASIAATLVRQWLDRRANQAQSPGSLPRVRPVPTVLIGIIGGFVVGLTSVGSGSVIIALLLLVYPTLRPNHLVGTDMVQAIPLVGAATVGHLLFGEVQFALTGSVLVGGIPGVLVGSALSARIPATVIQPAVTALLSAVAVSLIEPRPLLMLVMAIAGASASLVLTAPRGARPRTPEPQPGDHAPEGGSRHERMFHASE